MPFAAHGYASNFVLSLFDRYYKPNLNLEDGLRLADLCIAEIHTRFLIAQPNFVIKVPPSSAHLLRPCRPFLPFFTFL